MEIRKRRRLLKPSLSSLTYSGKLISLRTLFFSTLSFLLLLFLFLFLSHHPPSSKLILSSSSSSVFPELRIQSRILLPDSLLIFLLKPPTSSSLQFSLLSSKIDCVYPHPTLNKLAFHPSLSSSDYDDLRWLLRCPLPPSNYSSSASLQRHLSGFRPPPPPPPSPFPVPRWDWASYEAAIDGNTTVVFVKGFKLRPDKVYDPSQFRCRFESRHPKKRHTRNPSFSVTTSPAISAGQEIVRCPLPVSVRKSVESNHAVRVAVERPRNRQFPPSVARLYDRRGWDSKGDRYELCGCTMVWNQAAALREWVTYHAWMGVQRWFIYDNNSDDSLEDEIQKLNSENYNLTRHSWPWIKSQEAGFSQCVMRAKRECNWVAFFDVDEFFYFPPLTNHQKGNHSIGNNHINNDERGLLRELVAEYSTAPEVGEIRTKCHSFGPSGLVARPLQGVTVGYTCRLLRPERHKSIVRTDAVDDTLLNAVHHFKLREGFVFQDAPEGRVLINHYKYQVWDVFKAKFSRRVSTYVADWQDSQNENSRDRAPGLGKEAIQPLDWNRWYCEVWDTGLRDFVLANLANPDTGSLPWEPNSVNNSQS